MTIQLVQNCLKLCSWDLTFQKSANIVITLSEKSFRRYCISWHFSWIGYQFITKPREWIVGAFFVWRYDALDEIGVGLPQDDLDSGNWTRILVGLDTNPSRSYRNMFSDHTRFAWFLLIQLEASVASVFGWKEGKFGSNDQCTKYLVEVLVWDFRLWVDAFRIWKKIGWNTSFLLKCSLFRGHLEICAGSLTFTDCLTWHKGYP